MTGFVIAAALCALVAAAFVALPLWRPHPGQGAPQYLLGAAAILLVVSGAAALYIAWGHGSWRAATAPGSEGIAALLAATDEKPDDLQAWLDLGRGYLRINQWPLARRSFEHANRLGQGRNAEALGALAETSFFENNGELTPAVVEQFERALQLDPKLPAALFYTGVAQMNAGHLEIARTRFAALRDLNPPPQVKAALDKQIAAIDADLARAQPDPATAIRLRLSLAPGLADKVPANASLFAFVRAPEGGPPLAAKRLAASLPQEVVLSSRDSLIAGRGLRPGQRVLVMARLSASGAPVAQTGDLQGALSAVAGTNSTYQLVIDQRAP